MSPPTGVSISASKRTTVPSRSVNYTTVLGSPSLPLPDQWIAGLEREDATGCQRRADGSERGPDLVVADQFLECMPGHHRQVELTVPDGCR